MMIMVKLISCLFYVSVLGHWEGIGEVLFVHGSCTRSQADRTTTIWNIAGHEESAERDLCMVAHLQFNEPAQ